MSKRTESAIIYISLHFRKKILLDEVAKYAGISSFHFHRIFVTENDCTPHQYLEKVRMNHATHCMRVFPGWSITDIAFECGYTSPAIFSRAFKKYFGMSPTQYSTGAIAESPVEDVEIENPLQINYQKKRVFSVRQVSLDKDELDRAYIDLFTSCHAQIAVWGIYVDAPFHTPREKCRYFVGVESTLYSPHDHTLVMPAGYYTVLSYQGDFDQLKSRIMKVNGQIRSKGFVIDSLIGYEKIVSPKVSKHFRYLDSDREIFVKVRR